MKERMRKNIIPKSKNILRAQTLLMTSQIGMQSRGVFTIPGFRD